MLFIWKSAKAIALLSKGSGYMNPVVPYYFI